MLKIKDDVGLKVLEDYGFEYVGEFGAYVRECDYNYAGLHYEDIVCVSYGEREIIVDIPTNNVDKIIEHVIQDLIEDGLVEKAGEEYEYQMFTQDSVGNKGVTKIEYHEPLGEGDRHYCDIYYQNGKARRIFNINGIIFSKDKIKQK